MNVIDWVIVGIIGISVLFGLYRGFIASVASMGGCLISLGASYWLSPQLTEYVRNKTTLGDTLVSYTDAATRLGDKSLSGMSVPGLTQDKIAEIISRVSLPPPLDSLLKNNLEKQEMGRAHV